MLDPHTHSSQAVLGANIMDYCLCAYTAFPCGHSRGGPSVVMSHARAQLLIVLRSPPCGMPMRTMYFQASKYNNSNVRTPTT